MSKNLKKFTYDDVYNETFKYFNGDELAARVWINKYCLKDSEGNLYEKTPDDMHKRLASELFRIESKYPNPISENEIYEDLKDFKYIIPAGSSMSGIKNDNQIVSLSNCFVIGNKHDSDSYGGIMKLDQEMVQLQKRRGGVGQDLSFIRPKTTPVKNSALTSTGLVPFMERYSNSTREVAQDGRRGALMLSIDIKHPDAEDFIDAKLEDGKVTGANVSVKIDDEFMTSLKEGKNYIQHYPVKWDNFYKDEIATPFLESLYNNEITEGRLYKLADGYYAKIINPQKIWKKIVHNAWKSAEPGILFWDNVINESIPDTYHAEWKTVSTNPCGEIPLCPYDSCRLLSVNLYSYVENPFTLDAKFNFEKFHKDVIKAQRYMDDIIDLEIEKIDSILHKIENDPEDDFIKLYEKNLWEEIKSKAVEGRRTGLGITAEGDMLAALGYTYGTDNANKFANEVHRLFKLSAYSSSVVMAKERGAFSIYDSENEKNNPFILRIKDEDPELYSNMVKYGRRNIALLTIAPTGTVSLMTQTTSGIEPVFLPVYKRRKKVNPNDKNTQIDFVDDEGIAWSEHAVFHHKFKEYLKIRGYDIGVVKTMTKEQLDELVKQSPYNKATTNNVDWVKKVEMQGMIQKHIDHSISVTVNLPSDVNEDVVNSVYMKGWESGCKGITVYRDGSRSGVLISDNDKKEKQREKLFDDHHSPKRPKRLKGNIIRFQNNLEKWVAVVGILDDRPYEIFTGKLENGLKDLPTSLKDCEIVKKIITDVDEDGNKVKRKRYDIEYVDNHGDKQIHEGVNESFNPEFWNYAKLMSGILRHGMPIIKFYELIDSLKFREEHINTWKNGVVRVIKKFIKDGQILESECPKCHQKNTIQFKEGCLICTNCGHSKCG